MAMIITILKKRLLKISLLLLSCLIYGNGCLAATWRAVGDSSYPPLTFTDQPDRMAGYSIDVVKLIAKKVVLDIDIELMDWVVAQDIVACGEADILIGVNQTPRREAYFDFSEPFLENKLSMFVAKDNFTITKESDLAGRRIGVQVGDIGDLFLKARYPGINVNYYQNQPRALDDLAKGQLDVVLANYFTGMYWVDKSQFSDKIKAVGQPLLITKYCLAVPKGRTEILARINQGITAAKQSGEMLELQNEWFGENYFLHPALTTHSLYIIVKCILTAAGIIIITSLLFTYYARIRVERATEKLRKANLEVAEAYENTVRSFLNAMEKRDGGTVRHSLRVNKISLELGKMMNLSERDIFYLNWGTLLHDIGKLAISEKILLKPGRLTDDEYTEIKKHTTIGFDILRDISYLSEALDVILYHHERWDGKGYPFGLRGTDIPLLARICAVADAFEAMIADRPYRKGMSVDEAVGEMARCSGTQFDADIVKIFMRLDIKRMIG